MRVRKMSGFTLVELMIVVVILGLLAAVAIPAFTRYVKRSRTSEAMTNLTRIYSAEFTYNQESHERGLSGNFVNAPAMPSDAPRDSKYPANVGQWAASPEWASLGFALDGPHYYQYSCPASSGSFAATAQGDLDGDGTRSTFRREGNIVAGEIVGGQITIVNELE